MPIFKGPFLERVARGDHAATFFELGRHFEGFRPPPRTEPLSKWFDFFFDILFRKYRCEYVYKNAIATRLYLGGRHSFEDSLLTDELRSGQSRADVVILNGTSTVYEIKSRYDSFERIDSQLIDYRRLYDKIYVVTSGDRAYTALSYLGPSTGIMALDDDGRLYVVREAASNKSNTDPEALFDCMRQAEFTAVIEHAFGNVPNVPNSQLYRECKKLFCNLSSDIAHDYMVSTVKRRGKRKPFVDLINNAPVSLKHACLNFSKSQTLALSLTERLTQPLT